MRHRGAGRGLCIGAVGLALTLVPMSARNSVVPTTIPTSVP
jgi:hypothetical protein